MWRLRSVPFGSSTGRSSRRSTITPTPAGKIWSSSSSWQNVLPIGFVAVPHALDPPTTNSEFAERPNQNEDFLVLSTVHSAKGLEWDVVYTISAADGSFPFRRAMGSPEQIEEERRLFYVALTRAKTRCTSVFPQRSYQAWRGNYGDPYELARLTRFITPKIGKHFQSMAADVARDGDDGEHPSRSRF